MISFKRQLFFAFLLANIRFNLAQNPEISPGKLFLLELTKSSFFSEKDALPSDPVKFVASELHYPDVPAWLNFLQKDYTHNGLVFGSPSDSDKSLSLEVVAVNQRSFQTAYKIFNITVTPDGANDFGDLYVVELWIRNLDLDEILDDKQLSVLMRRLKRIWNAAANLQLVKLASILAVSGRQPVPSSPRQQIKEGVIVQIGAAKPFSNELLSIRDLIRNERPCDPSIGSRIDANRKFAPEFDVDWCQLKLVDPVMSDYSESAALPLDSDDTLPWRPRSAGIKRQSLLVEFIITVIVPLCLGILAFIILSYVMFGRRDKRDQWATPTQLEQYHTIRTAMTNLRYMSNYRDGPPPLSAPTSPTPSAANTLSRTKEPSQAPPPYRVPPSYNARSDDQAVDQPRSKEEEPTPTDQAHLMPEGSPETLKVRK